MIWNVEIAKDMENNSFLSNRDFPVSQSLKVVLFAWC